MTKEIVQAGSNDVTGALTAREIRSRVQLVHQVMKSVMREGAHYGKIPGCDKPTLFKPGSELLLSTFRIAVIPKVEDLSERGEARYRVVCQGVLPNGDIIGEGIGECSSEEEKYKWRSAVCDAEFNETDEDRRRVKYYRNGSKVKQVRMNAADVANTVLKMAKKRAQMDLTLTCTGASDVFTQDVEDMPAEVAAAVAADRETVRKEATAERSASVKPAQQSVQEAEIVGVSLAEQIDLALDYLTGGDDGAKKNLLVEASRGGKKEGPMLVYTKLHLPETSQPWLKRIMEYLEPKVWEKQEQDGAGTPA